MMNVHIETKRAEKASSVETSESAMKCAPGKCGESMKEDKKKEEKVKSSSDKASEGTMKCAPGKCGGVE